MPLVQQRETATDDVTMGLTLFRECFKTQRVAPYRQRLATAHKRLPVLLEGRRGSDPDGH